MVSEVNEQSGMSGALSRFDGVKEDVVEHLMFHKALIDQERNGERIDDYLDMIDQVGEDSYYHISEDPFECAIASVFKLVIDEKMDPWDINLVSFTSMYLEEAKDKESINFIVAGELIHMAWSILKMQCEEVLQEAESHKEEEEETVQDEFISQWDIFDYEMYDEPEDIDYEEEVLESEDPPLERAVRREEKNPISLIQLVDAFEEAKREAKYREKMERIRKENCEEEKERERERKKNYDSKAHKEDLHHDIAMIWERICWYEQEVLEFDMIHDGRTSDLVTALMSVLFLNKEKKIKLDQEKLPEGPILVKNLVPLDEREEGVMKYIAEEEENLSLENIATI